MHNKHTPIKCTKYNTHYYVILITHTILEANISVLCLHNLQCF